MGYFSKKMKGLEMNVCNTQDVEFKMVNVSRYKNHNSHSVNPTSKKVLAPTKMITVDCLSAKVNGMKIYGGEPVFNWHDPPSQKASANNRYIETLYNIAV